MKIQPPPVSRHSKTAFRTPQPEHLAATLDLIGFDRYDPARKDQVARIGAPGPGYAFIKTSGIVYLDGESAFLAAALRAMAGEVAPDDLARFLVRPDQEPYGGFWTNQPYKLRQLLLESKAGRWAVGQWSKNEWSICKVYRNDVEACCYIRLTYDGRALPGGDDPAPAIDTLKLLVAATGGEVR